MSITKTKKTADMKAYMKEYMKNYYLANKEKFLKKTDGTKKRGQRGKGKNLKFKLTVMNDNDTVLMSNEYNTQKEIARVLALPEYTISRIFKNQTKSYKNYKIEKL